MKRWFIALLLGCIALSAGADPLSPNQVPAPLKPWVGWALYGAHNRTCPFLYNDFAEHRCAWPGTLQLDLSGHQGAFSQSWSVQRRSWITLPGDARHWPQQVTVDDAPAPVTVRKGRPAVRIDAGDHRIRGAFRWESQPESLALAPDTGLVSLTIDGRAVAFPDISKDGRLWLRGRKGGSEAAGQSNRLDIQVYRHVIDGIPMQVVTRLDLDVAGAAREVLLGPALLGSFIPLRLDSPLPARLDRDGRIRVQVRPGHWSIELAARSPADETALKLPAIPAPWPATEVWAFEPHNHLRLVDVQGVPSVDPRQTNLPAAWQKFPAYRMHAGDTLKLKVIRRGDQQPEPNRLRLQRRLWLDFDGGGYTVNDRISGTMTRGWRLEAAKPLQLGRVSINGRAQLITRRAGSGLEGVEVRHGSLKLSADSRIDKSSASLPATGWDQDFQQVSETLNLPPGWTLFWASGVDNVPDTWVQRWTLLDLFLVLIAALAAARLWGRGTGALMLVTLALIWHEPGAPRYVWLNLLAAVALLRVLPEGRLRSAARLYRGAVIAALAVIAVPFLVNQVKLGLFPQLERPWQSVTPVARQTTAFAAKPPAPKAGAPSTSIAGTRLQRATPPTAQSEAAAAPPLALDKLEPNAKIQTGPGLPQWQWTRIALRWNGPVEQGQRLHLLLLSPTANLFLNFLRVALVLFVGILVLRLRRTGSSSPPGAAAAAVVLLALPGLLALAPTAAHAEMPDPALLKQLRERLLAPPDCAPACAHSPRMQLDIAPQTLQIRLEIDALADVAVPLPGHAGEWVPTQVAVDGVPAAGPFRRTDGSLWISLSPGVHQVVLGGPLPGRDSVQLALPLRPGRADVQAQGWRVAGVHENGVADAQLVLTRLKAASAKPAAARQPATLPPFARVQRTLHLGLDWHVDTRVTRASPPGTAIVMQLPLLPGESVTTEGIRVRDGKVQVNLGAGEQEMHWESVLQKSNRISLHAPQTTAWAEDWRLDASPIWHVEASGIPVVHHRDAAGRWLPEWRPWPGESVTLTVTRPPAVAGRTLTIDDSRLLIRPGTRAAESTLQLRLRSSLGGQHTITLPPEAKLQNVLIDGRAQPVRQNGRQVSLPLIPGTQHVRLTWRQPGGIKASFFTPKVNLDTVSVNSSIETRLGSDRWVLYTAGPRLGPAVLFWGLVVVIALIAAILGRIPLTPLGGWQWLLLGVGLSQAPVWSALIVVAWLLALGARRRLAPDTRRGWFNLAQIGLTLLTLAALALLFHAVKQGLLGMPEMQIAGNGSTAHALRWYQDRSAAELPRAWVLSVPLLVYRVLMLAWALWLAAALLRWLRWGWGCFCSNGIWRPLHLFRRRDRADTSPAETGGHPQGDSSPRS